MQIRTKYKISQQLFFIKNSGIRTGEVEQITINVYSSVTCISYIMKNDHYNTGDTDDRRHDEERLFISKEELKKSL